MNYPSRSLQKKFKSATGESSFFLGLEENKELLESIVVGMNSPFGAALISSLETIETAGFASLLDNTNSVAKLAQSRAEIKVARYMKGILLAYVQELDTLTNSIKQLHQEEETIYDN